MTGEEIKKLIDEKNQEIKEIFEPNFFIINNRLKQITEEIAELQSQCPHDFEDGFCNFCNKAQEEGNN